LIILEEINDFVVHSFGDETIFENKSVCVWIADLDEQRIEPAQLSWLSASEYARAARLKSPLDHRRHLASRVITRRLLSKLTGIAPKDLDIITDKCGKPRLRLPTAEGRLPSETLLGFNISHSENILTIATALGGDVGIDIEVVNLSLNVLATSRACLDQQDIDQVRFASSDERSLVFYRLWTRREAFAKMQGHGVASDHVHHNPAQSWSLRSFEFAHSEKQIVGSTVTGA
jgi:4'-phosphopantetheinyl transferase